MKKMMFLMLLFPLAAGALEVQDADGKKYDAVSIHNYNGRAEYCLIEGKEFITGSIACSKVKLPDFKTAEGVEYKNVKLSAIDQASISITHKSGAATVKFASLPEDMKSVIKYQPLQGEALAKKQAVEAKKQEMEKIDRPVQKAPSDKNPEAIWDLGGSSVLTEVQRRQRAIENWQYIHPDDMFYARLSKDLKCKGILGYNQESVKKSGLDPIMSAYTYSVEVKYRTEAGFERWDTWSYAIKDREKKYRVKIGNTVYNTFKYITAPRSATSGFMPEADRAKGELMENFKSYF